MSPLRSWLLWTAGFLSFPIGGVLAGLVTGRTDAALPALIAGLITGAVIGAGQRLVSARRLDWRRWVPASAAGMAVGLPLGGLAVGFGTSPADLATMGAITGVALGIAQALALPVSARHRWAWAVAMPALWALGWTVTTLAGVRVGEQFTVFGSTGALTVSALLGLLLQRLVPAGSNPVPAHLTEEYPA
jgi:hypothetical protein